MSAAPAADRDAASPASGWKGAGCYTALLVFALTTACTVLAFPPYHLPELAYVFALPASLWAYRRPAFRLFAGTVLGSQAVAWTIILDWLHHVSWGGLFLLGPFLGVWHGIWFLAIWWLLPRLPGRPVLVRLAAILGLAGGWVVLEWTHTWLLGGFPWLPLAASQWQRVAVLQIAAYTGAGGVSFVLLVMNLGFAAWAHQLGFERTRDQTDGRLQLGRSRSPELITAMLLLVGCLIVHVREAVGRAPYLVPDSKC